MLSSLFHSSPVIVLLENILEGFFILSYLNIVIFILSNSVYQISSRSLSLGSITMGLVIFGRDNGILYFHVVFLSSLETCPSGVS